MTKNLTGLTEKEAALSREKHGSNALTRQKQRGFWRHFAGELADPVIRVLMLALGLDVLLVIARGGFERSDAAEIAGITLSILAAALVSTVSGYRAERALDALGAAAGGREYLALRGGVKRVVDVDDLVVGDVVFLGAGDAVPADGMLVDGALTLDQSTLNGESREARKLPGEGRCAPDDPHALLRGAFVASGEGVMRVVRVGDATFYGGISRELSRAHDAPSPLKKRLTVLARQISRIGYIASGLVFAADLVFSFAGPRTGSVPEEVLHALTLAITVVVVAVPEGLPMMISVVLSANTRKMARDGVLVRRPVGIETAGNIDLLFCDKTGTLTRGKLRVCALVDAVGGEYASLASLPPALRGLFESSVVCNNAAQATPRGAVGSNSTDRALLEFAGGAAQNKSPVREAVPFDPARKYSSVRLLGRDDLTLVKGAPDVVLPACRAALAPDGTVLPLDRRAALAEVAARAARASRMIAFAFSRGGGEMTYLGLCEIRDRPRAGVRKAVETLRRAGVRTVMLTGDARETAVAVARECGIVGEKDEGIVTSAELARMSDAEAAAFLPRLRVLARALPSDKSRLVRLAGEAGAIFAMTGDGTNDAPALKAAPVGFAMGSGSDVAREAGDVVILDDDLSSIVRAVLYGRTIFHSIRKFIVFQLTMNLCAVGVSLVAPFFGVDTPVTVTQMLWINMIMDTLAGLAFAGESPREKYLREPPRDPAEGVLCRAMVARIVTNGAWSVALGLFFLTYPGVAARYGSREALLCGFFCCFVFCGLFCALGARTETVSLTSRLAANKPFVVIMALIAAVQIALVYLGGPAFRCTPLTWPQLGFALTCAASVIPVEMIRKIAVRLNRAKRGGTS